MACLRSVYCKFSERKTRAGEEKIDGYDSISFARRAKSGEWQGAKKKLCVGEKTTGVNKACAGLTVRCSAQVQPYLAPPAQKAVNGSVRRKKLCVGGKITGVDKACAGLKRRRSRSRFTANETAKSRLRNPAAP